jgi:plastocyanin domain-containing protein
MFVVQASRALRKPKQRADNARVVRMLALVLLCCANAAQSMSLRQLQALEKQDKQSANYVRYYLVGVMEGLVDAEKVRSTTGARARICQADKRMEPAMALSLFEAERKRNRDMYEADMPVALVMRNALQNAYPCPE